MSDVKKQSRIDWLDGLRALAILCVIAVHSSQVAGLLYTRLHQPSDLGLTTIGQYGVQLFFIISALTIYITLSAHLKSGESISSWYVRRLFRIAPLYYLAIILYFIENKFIVGAGGVITYGAFSPIGILSNIFFIHAWVPLGNNSIVPGGWSIGVEMSFYLIAPFMFLLMQRKIWPVLFFGLGLSFLTISAMTGPIENNGFFYFWPPTQFPVFLCGLGLAGTIGKRLFGTGNFPRVWQWWAAAIFIISFSIAAYLGSWGNRSHLLAPTAFGISFCGLVLLARGALNPLFSNRMSVWIGGLSYSMYIIHFSVLFLFRLAIHKVTHIPLAAPWLEFAIIFIITAGFSALLSSISRQVIEKPGIRLGSFVAKRLNAFLCRDQTQTRADIE